MSAKTHENSNISRGWKVPCGIGSKWNQRIRKISGHRTFWQYSVLFISCQLSIRNIAKPLQAHRLYKMCSTVASEQQVVTEAEMYFSHAQEELLFTKGLFNLMGLPEAQGLLLSNFSLSSSVSNPDRSRVQSGQWIRIRIRIQEGKIPTKKYRYWMFSFEG